MKVYRLQSRKDRRKGAYRTYIQHGLLWHKTDSVGDLLTDGKDGDSHPSPYLDPIMSDNWQNERNTKNYYFGCKTYQDILDWFSNTELNSEVYRKVYSKVEVAVYEVPAEYVMNGTNQIAFFLDKAVLLYTHPLEELLIKNH